MGGPGGTVVKPLLLFAFLLLPLLSPLPVDAQGVPVHIQVILASKEPGERTDPAIAPLVRELQRHFAYSSYRLLQTQSGQVEPQRSLQASLPGGRALAISLLGAAGGRVDLQVTTSGVNTRVNLRRGGPPFLVGGPPHGPGVLIIAISAR